MSGTEVPYKPRCILVTGGAGFIASHVVIRLVHLHPEYKVVVLDKMDYCASMNNLATCVGKPNFKCIKGDVQSMDLLAFLLNSEEIDTVMHFAAQTHVDNSFGNSLAFTMNNTYGTHVLLEACRMAGTIRRFINVSTDEVYGESSFGKELGLLEHSHLDPTNPYSAAKAGAEMLCKAYITSYKLPIIITRGNNVYGPHQFPEKLIPKFTLLASRGETLPVHGAGDSVRSYLYVEDVAEAFLCVLHQGVTGEVYNIGTDSERTVLQVAQDIAKRFNMGVDKIVNVKDRAFNDRRYYIGSSKLAELGWKERTSWEEGLKKTVDWYLKTNCNEYWLGDVEAALKPHPVVMLSPL
uniref:NAD(P)-binding domain-containing protein n=2 Tax=Dunaliella tertiolecta TaxID=3047 RepID=A0A7S3QQD2_DUNTE|mmetsp:Transcript_3368/g.9009  ORF Transcript_3368/g.9009 Transcript_3368/m.9009 type:complete len:351 (+) Transcript_3368:163-1215(+)